VSYSFTNKIFKQGLNPYVDVPQPLCEALVEAVGQRGYLPVRVTIKEALYQATLTPRGGGGFRLFLTDEMRKRKGFKVGTAITITLEPVTASDASEPPPDLAAALSANPATQAAFEQQTEARRRELLRWLREAKNAEMRAKCVQHILDFLLTGQT
jgi:hypothetical protein